MIGAHCSKVLSTGDLETIVRIALIADWAASVICPREETASLALCLSIREDSEIKYRILNGTSVCLFDYLSTLQGRGT